MTDSNDSHAQTEARLSQLALVGHVVLLVFSGIAFATFLAPQDAEAQLLTAELLSGRNRADEE